MGHDKSRYLAWRRRYQPAPIELIIVAESPPKSGKYFYDPDGSHRREILFREMMKQLKVTCSSKDDSSALSRGSSSLHKTLRSAAITL